MSRKQHRVVEEEEAVLDAVEPGAKQNHEFTDSEILDIIEKNFGSLHNILQLAGGPGTYLILGPTESGKTVSIGAMAREAQVWALQKLIKLKPVTPSSVIIISDTNELTDDFAWCKSVSVTFPMDNASLSFITEEREKEMRLGSNMSSQTPAEWAQANPLFIAIDDFYGKIEAAQPNNPVNILCTKARHYGIYLFVLAQGYNQCGPVIKDNARAILCFRLSAHHHQDIYTKKYGHTTKAVIKNLTKHNSKLYYPVVYYRTWELSKEEYGGITPRFILLSPFIPIKKPKKEEHQFQSMDDEIVSSSSESEDE